MKRLCHLGILKEGFLRIIKSSYANKKKFIKDKGCVSDFRQINISIAKINFASP